MVNSDLTLERSLWEAGYTFVVGVDEAGRGPWAGPVVAGAVCFEQEQVESLDLRDSKKLTHKKREELYALIKGQSKGYGTGFVTAEQIDQIGIQYAVQNAMLEAIHKAEQMICSSADFLLIDGNNVLDIGVYKQKKIIKGDDLHYSISAAAILAKVERDRYMEDLGKRYPEYFFEKHKGYGTKVHKENLEKFGPIAEHRLSYKPVKKVAEKFGFNR